MVRVSYSRQGALVVPRMMRAQPETEVCCARGGRPWWYIYLSGLVKLYVFCNLPQGPGQPIAISTAVLQVCAEINAFESLNNYMFD